MSLRYIVYAIFMTIHCPTYSSEICINLQDSGRPQILDWFSVTPAMYVLLVRWSRMELTILNPDSIHWT
jgi:hypothetical protein